MNYLLGIDQGSTNCHVGLFDVDGQPIAYADHPIRLSYPKPGWVEADPDAWWYAVTNCIRKVLEESKVDSGSIIGIGITGLQHTAVLIGKSGKPLSNAIMWMDLRSQYQAKTLIEEHSAEIQEIMGTEAHMAPFYTIPRLLWIRQNQPSLLSATSKLVWAKDFIRYRLTGEMASDATEARGAFLLHPQWRWATEMLHLIGVSEDILPPLMPSEAIAGYVTREASKQTGLLEGTPIITGCGDVPATLIGANVHRNQQGCLYIGTASWVAFDPFSVYLHKPTIITKHGLKWRLMAAGATGATVEWYRRLLSEPFGATDQHASVSYETLSKEAEQAGPGANGIIFLPHLMGERGIGNYNAKGCFFGLTLQHSQSDLIRAVFEGSAYLVRQLCELLGEAPETLVLAGGGAKSSQWSQIFADILGIQLLIPQVVDAGALGVAALAGVGAHIFPSVQDAAKHVVQYRTICVPNHDRHLYYNNTYKVYRQLEDRLAPLYSQLPIEYRNENPERR